MVALDLLLASLTLPSLICASACISRGQRRPWHTLSDTEKHEYINAELCVMKLPPKVGLPGAKNVFDELQANHQIQASWSHFVGQFLPYHRYLMFIHEQVLRTDCGYKGHQPYWDEPRDAGQFSSSVLFDSVTGFGGDGRKSDGCITDGPFANYTNSIGPGYLNTNHCITRNISDVVSQGSSQSEVNHCNIYTTFATAYECIQTKPHNGGHTGTGGQMANPISSPGDPIFYLHHTWLDKVWWDWQALNLSSRLYDIGGYNRQLDNFTFNDVEGGANGTYKAPSYTGDPGNVTTLNHVLSSLGLWPNTRVHDVMDIRGPYLCYEYVEAEDIFYPEIGSSNLAEERANVKNL